MTKSRKLGISVALTLLVVLTCALFIPLYSVNNANVAHAVTVQSRDEWVNSYNGTYYNNLNTDKTGTAFRSDLAKLITDTHKHQTSYDEVKSVFLKSDVDPNNKNNVIWFYTGTSVPYKGTMLDKDYPTNREHVWPKNAGKAFPAETGPGGDSHHLRPLNDSLNSTRSSLSFGELTPGASGVSVVSENGTTNYGNLCYKSSSYFYPGKGYRGATARILFYMQTRWGDQWGLSFVDSAGSNKTIGKISDLMKWHLQEPPTDEEIRRNEVVFGIQGNRNPFIDHPEYAEMIYCNDGQSYNNKLKQTVATYGSYLDNSNPGGGTVTPDPTPTLTSITLSQTSLSLTVGQSSSQITVTANPSTVSNSVTWSTSNSSVATVNNGVVTAVGAGTATITATSTVNTEKTATLTVTVTAAQIELQSLTVSPNSLNLTTGGTRQLTVTASPQGASNSVTWSSSDSNVATVSQGGLVTAVGAGTATITATSTVNTAKTATLTVTVTAAQVELQSLTVSPGSLSLTPNKTQQLTVTAKPIGADSRVTWSSSDESVATVSQTGLVTSVAEGTATITAISVENPNIKAEITVTVISQQQNSQAFTDSMSAIDGANTLEERYLAIRSAINSYNQMSDGEKAANAQEFARLQQFIQDYNAEVAKLNGEFESANNLAAQIMVNGVSLSFMALVAIVIKRMLGR